MSIFMTSDLHFCHNQPFLYEPRGFSSIEEHDNELVYNWNGLITDDDIVYILGDLVLSDKEKGIDRLKKLKGQLKIIIGNHDTPAKIEEYKKLPNVEILGYSYLINYKHYNIYLSHYPTLTANFDDDKPLRAKVINLYGHTHQKTNFHELSPLMYHVGLDSHENKPVLLDTIIEDIKNWSK